MLEEMRLGSCQSRDSGLVKTAGIPGLQSLVTTHHSVHGTASHLGNRFLSTTGRWASDIGSTVGPLQRQLGFLYIIIKYSTPSRLCRIRLLTRSLATA